MDKQWAWQPFGPDETINCFSFAGSHYRGFPVIKVNDVEKEQIKSGQRFTFTYKGLKYVAIEGCVMTQADELKAIIANHNRVLDEFLGR